MRTILMLMASITALSIGGWIYVVGRPNTYIYDLWHAHIALHTAVSLPEFVRYSLPGALWSLSSILMLHTLLHDDSPGRRLMIIAIVPMLGIVSEILQWMGLLPGVYDICDLGCYALPLIAYLIIQSYHKK